MELEDFGDYLEFNEKTCFKQVFSLGIFSSYGMVGVIEKAAGRVGHESEVNNL